MVEPGGLRDIFTVKLAILYVLSYWNTSISYTSLSEIILLDGLVDFFDFSSALYELLESCHILSQGKEKENYFITEKGSEAIGLFQERIPFSVREKLIKTAKEFKATERL